MARQVGFHILAALCAWHHLSAQVNISVSPPMPTSRDTIVVTIEGTSGNNLARLDFQKQRIGYAINAQLSAYSGLLPVVMPWRVKDTVGVLPVGSYTYSLTFTTYASNFQGGYTLTSRQVLNRGFVVSSPTQVESYSPSISFRLGQNYPNPFNSSTIIPFEVKESCTAELSITSITGETISIFAGELSRPGIYSFVWDASHNASGGYYYHLRVGSLSETRRALLIR